MAKMKNKREYRVGVGERGLSGKYVKASSKREALKKVRDEYRKRGYSSKEARRNVRWSHTKLWRNVDGSVAKWRKK